MGRKNCEKCLKNVKIQTKRMEDKPTEVLVARPFLFLTSLVRTICLVFRRPLTFKSDLQKKDCLNFIKTDLK